MLVCSLERYVPTNVNILTLEGIDGRYYYVHRQLYDQAVVLEDKYIEHTDELVKQIIGSDSIKCDSVEYFLTIVPRPLNILGYFLLLIRDIETAVEPTIENLCGAIHQISVMISLRELVRVPINMRNSVSFSLRIMEEYQLAWNRFFQESIPYQEEMFLMGAKAYINNIQGTTNNASIRQAQVDQPMSVSNIQKFDPKTWDYSKEPDFDTMSDEDIDAYWVGLDAYMEGGSSNDTDVKAEVKEEPKAAEEPKVGETPKKSSGLDLIRGMA